VLYFAQYIITDIDEDQSRRFSRKSMKDRVEGQQAGEGEPGPQSRDRQSFEGRVANLEKQKKSRLRDLQKQREQRVEAVVEAASLMEERLTREENQIAMEAIVFKVAGQEDEKSSVVARSSPRCTSIAARCAKRYIDHIETIIKEEKSASRRRSRPRKIAAPRGARRNESLNTRCRDDVEDVRKSYSAQRDEVEDLEKLQLINENRFRELHEKYGRVFKGAMGAEAIHDIVSRSIWMP